MRCRLITSSWCTSWEGFDCSSIKVVRELGSIRRNNQMTCVVNKILYAGIPLEFLLLNYSYNVRNWAICSITAQRLYASILTSE